MREKKLAPGEETTLQVEVQMPADGDEREIVCVLATDTGQEWVHVFKLRTYPYLQFDCKQPHLSFGEVDPGAEVEKIVPIRLHAPAGKTPPPLITSVRCEPRSLHAAFSNDQEYERLGGDGMRRKARVGVALRAQKLAGRYCGQITVRYGGAPIEGEAHCTVGWSVASPFRVQPQRISLGAIRGPCRKCMKSVAISRDDGAPLHVISVQVESPYVTVTSVESASEAETRIQFEIDTRDLAGAFFTEGEVTTDHPLQPTIRIPISGRSIE